MEASLYFIIRYTPFWGIPLIFIAAPAAYIYWLKDIKKVALGFSLVTFISFYCTALWVWAGGPDRSIEYFQEFTRILLH